MSETEGLPAAAGTPGCPSDTPLVDALLESEDAATSRLGWQQEGRSKQQTSAKQAKKVGEMPNRDLSHLSRNGRRRYELEELAVALERRVEEKRKELAALQREKQYYEAKLRILESMVAARGGGSATPAECVRLGTLMLVAMCRGEKQPIA